MPLTAKPPAFSADLAMECIRVAPLFCGLSESACAEIAAATRERMVVRGETVFCEDDVVQSVLVLATGRIKITQLSRTGKEVILRVENAGEVVDAHGLSSGKTHLIGAQAIETCLLLSWALPTFDTIMQRYPEIPRNAARILSERLRALQERFRDIATERVPQRLARLLLSLIKRENGPGCPNSIDFSQEELAQMTGTTLFTVSRVLCEWASQGIIQSERKAILVESLPGLAALAQGSEEL